MAARAVRSPGSTATRASYGRVLRSPVLAAAVWSLLLAAAMLWPTLRSGYPLTGDMVFTPHQPFGAAALGVGTASPRAVPLDAVVAGLGRVVGGWLVARLALVGPLLLAGIGAARVVRPTGHTAALAAASAAVLNPFVVERLALGQWALLWAYAVLPWLVLGVRRALPATGSVHRRWVLALGLPVALASVTPTGGVIALVVTVALAITAAVGPGSDARLRPAAAGRWAGAAAVTVVALLAQAPWVTAGALSGASRTADPAGVAAFAARDEYGGVVVSLLGGGGVWNGDVVPASRGTPLTVVAAVLVVAALACGLRPLAARLGRPAVTTLVVLAVVGVVVAVLPSTGPGADLVRWALRQVPGAGLLRDAQKWIAPWVALTAWSAGTAAERLVVTLRDRGAGVRVAMGLAVVVAPLLLLPGGPATVAAVVRPVRYPSDWTAVGAVLHADTRHGAVAVLPAGSYRRFDWAGGRTVLDPAPRLLDARVVVDDTLTVSGTTVAGEDPLARDVRDAVRHDPTSLAGLGVGWVLVERGQPGPPPQLTGLTAVFAGADLQLYRVPGRPAATSGRGAVAVVVAHLVWAAVLVLGAAAGAAGRVGSRARRRRSAPPAPPSC